MALGHNGRSRLRRNGYVGGPGGRCPSRIRQALPAIRSARLPVDDGAPTGRASPRAPAERTALPALRPDRESQPEAPARRGLREPGLPKRDHLGILGGGIPQRDFPRKHQTIFRYAKGSEWFYEPEYKPYKENTQQVGKHSTYVPVERRDINLERGTPVTDWWTDINTVTGWSPERLGYQTQKPTPLLKRIIKTSCPPDGVILDPFCGCGTTVDAAQELGHRWVGIDITHLAIGLIKHRLADRYGPEIAATYRVIGEPTTVEDAAVLAREDPFQFQAWALGLVGARVAGSDKKGGDKGIDGRLYFHDAPGGETRQIIFSVKAGEHLSPSYVRDLRGVIEKEGAQIGVLITFADPTPGMLAEAASAGFYTSPWGRHPRLQLRTVAQLLDGKGIDYPHVAGANVTFQRAERVKKAAEQAEMFGD